MQEQAVEVAKEQKSISGITTGFAVGAFLFWLTVKVIQLYSW